MSLAVLDRVLAGEAALIAALDGDDIDLLETAIAGFGAAVAGLRGVAAWRADEATEDAVARALTLAEAARVRIAWLADRNHRRLDLLAATAGRRGTLSPVYRCDGRMG